MDLSLPFHRQRDGAQTQLFSRHSSAFGAYIAFFKQVQSCSAGYDRENLCVPDVDRAWNKIYWSNASVTIHLPSLSRSVCVARSVAYLKKVTCCLDISVTAPRAGQGAKLSCAVRCKHSTSVMCSCPYASTSRRSAKYPFRKQHRQLETIMIVDGFRFRVVPKPHVKGGANALISLLQSHSSITVALGSQRKHAAKTFVGETACDLRCQASCDCIVTYH